MDRAIWLRTGFLLVLLNAVPAVWADPSALRVGVEERFPLVFWTEDGGHAKGIYVDLLREIAWREQWKLRFTRGKLKAQLRALQQDELDLVVGAAQENDDGLSLSLSEEAVLVQWAQVYAQGPSTLDHWLTGLGLKTPAIPPASSFPDLHQRTLAVFDDSRHVRDLRRLCRGFQLACSIRYLPQREQVYQALHRGEVDFAMFDNFDAMVIHPDLHIVPTGIVFSPVPLHVAARMEDDSDVLEKIDAYLRDWKQDPASPYHEIVREWLRGLPQVVHPESSVSGYLTVLSAGILLLLGLLGGLGLSFRRTTVAVEPPDFQRLQHSERHYRTLVENMPYGIQEFDLDGRILFGNIAAVHIYGYHHGEMSGRSLFDSLAFSSQREELRCYLRDLQRKQAELEPYEATVLRRDGEHIEVRLDLAYKRNTKGNIAGFFALVTDITEINRLKERITDQQQELKKATRQHEVNLAQAYEIILMTATVFEHTEQAILVVDPEGRIQSANPAFVNSTGYTEADVLQRDLLEFIGGNRAEEHCHRIWERLHASGSWQGELWLLRTEDKPYPAWASINAVRDGSEHLKQYVVMLTDISQIKRAQQQIRHQAHFDNLTGLPNRTLFHLRLQQAIARAIEDEMLMAVIFVDLDHFKEVNDTLGHDAGDELLKQVAARLSRCIRKSDTVARMGGDEFTIILSPLKTKFSADQTAQRILAKLSDPFPLQAKTVNISGSLGIALCPLHGRDMDTLLKNADTAMYEAKENGRDIYRIFQPAKP